MRNEDSEIIKFPMKIKKQLLIPLMALCAGSLPSAGMAEMKAPPPGYEIRNDGVYFGYRPRSMTRLKNADKETFKVYAYDTKTFKALKNGSFAAGDYGRDKTHVYYNENIIKGADPDSFEVLVFERGSKKYFGPNYEKSYSKDKSHVYHRGKIIDKADPASFKLLGDSHGGDYYWKDKSHVYYIDRVVTGADPNSFQVLNSRYAKDKSHVYRGDVKVDGDPNTFEILDFSIVKDKSHVWAHGRVWKGEDAASFEMLKGGTYLKDKSNVYYITNDVRELLKTLKGADPSSFKVLNRLYAKDKSSVWRLDKIIKGADPASFEIVEDVQAKKQGLDSDYTKDKSHVYFYGEIQKKLDPASFKILGQGYMKDKSHVYYEGKILTGADPATFKNVKDPDHFWKDKSRVYYYGKVAEGYDPKSYN